MDDRVAMCLSVAEECVQEAELHLLFRDNASPVAYDGFEPSGRMHIAQGILKALAVKKLEAAGVRFIFWIADLFALLNHKMDGDLSSIQDAGRRMEEIWRALGLKVEFKYASEEINKRPEEYWALVMDIATKNSLKRIKRCSQIMGRSETDALSAAQILYPCMQVADVFFLGADICQLGMDQRKVNVLAREYAESCTPKRRKPIVLSHSMMPGLLKGQAKMSKSNPDSAIFMDDTAEEVTRKIWKAYCPPGEVEDNPCLAYVRHIVLPWCGTFGSYTSFQQVEDDYVSTALHPADLKTHLAKHLNAILQPVRDRLCPHT